MKDFFDFLADNPIWRVIFIVSISLLVLRIVLSFI